MVAVASIAPDPEALLVALFDAAVERASAIDLLERLLPDPPSGRTIVIGAGKAAGAMAHAFDQSWPHPLEGLVVTRYGHGAPCARIEVVEAGHPIPDDAGRAATERMLALVSSAGADDLVVALISGGGSALLAAPSGPLTLEDERAVTAALLRSGATIGEINCVRKHLSAVKGGRLALAAAPARMVTYLISDVPGDDPATIASGPTLPDATTRQEALGVLDLYGIDAPGVRAWLADPCSETPKTLFESEHYILATAAQALEAAADMARRHGYEPIILGDAIEGEARSVARDHAAHVRRLCRDRASAGPRILLSGGETSVTIKGKGRGGRNAEFLLALAIELNGVSGVHALAADTDGIDGTEENAGALIGPNVLAEAAARGLDAAAMLDDNDGYGFFTALGRLLVTGPTRTNVNDFRAILIDAR